MKHTRSRQIIKERHRLYLIEMRALMKVLRKIVWCDKPYKVTIEDKFKEVK